MHQCPGNGGQPGHRATVSSLVVVAVILEAAGLFYISDTVKVFSL
jgi:hypothetical protein